jgi:hypothetical protein
MKNILSAILLMWFVALYSSALAQEPDPVSKQSRPLIKEKDILVQYDPSKNETAVYIYPYLTIYQSERNFFAAETLSVTTGFTYSGQSSVATPKLVEFGLISHAKLWRFSKERERKLTVIVDGEHLELGLLNRIKSKTVPIINMQNLSYIENLALFIPLESFSKIANGENVFIEAGGYKVKLRKEHLKVFRKLLSRMKP